MRKRFVILIGVLIVAGVCGVSWLVLRGHEPVYEGKSLGQYLDHLAKSFPPSVDGSDIKAVHAMGPAAIPYLRRALHRKESITVKGLVFLHKWLPKNLGDRLPSPPTPEYMSSLAAGASDCLTAFGPIAHPAVPDLLDRFDDFQSINFAYSAVSQIGPKPEDLPQLLVLAKGTNWGEPLYAVDLIGKVGVASPKVLEVLTNLAVNGQAYTREHAIRALGDLGPKADSAIPLLTRNLEDPDASIRINTAAALWRVEGRTNPPVAFIMKEFKNELDQVFAPSSMQNVFGRHEVNLLRMILLLKEVGNEAKPAAPLLRRVRSEKMIMLRLQAADALWTINQETNGLESTCIEGLAYFDSSDQMVAADLLSRVCIEQHKVLPTLNDMMASKDVVVQFYAARALWKINGETDRTIPAIMSGLQDYIWFSNANETRRLAAETLGEMGPKARSAVPSLVIALHDDDVKVIAAATNALKQIDPAAAAKAGVR